ncbi:chalcone isomerase family protein [Desulfuromonas sp. AOP6]|uniref:chalcone isomerase family protein n=1 Tax=Desulfuromonas sp. AOP6 TaxID=1566351 RepID=UPI00127778AF|nr:chalcone isomerase family protein [Desulfuromonas sp. AOP6]BCA79084.1 chalcone isomerase [Desulfuromonas sp. AOP6]
MIVRLLLSLLLLAPLPVLAVEVEGVQLPDRLEVQGETLHHNGHGIRKKLFFDIYIGSLYTATPVRSLSETLASPGAKLILMDFLYKKVEKEKIIEAFREGLANQSAALASGEEAKAFLAWFGRDFVRGDRVELELGGDGTVTARHNGELLGTLHSTAFAEAVLGIYLGDKPADARLKAGMLQGKER